MDRDLDQLKAWIIKEKLKGCSVTEICTSAKISRDMFYRWWKRYQTQGKNGLSEKPKGRPKSSSLDDSLKEKVLKIRRRYEWGPNKIAGTSNTKVSP
jgi:transposase